jgi:hypothetical protein
MNISTTHVDMSSVMPLAQTSSIVLKIGFGAAAGVDSMLLIPAVYP